MRLLIDTRWRGNHGIGRYARELIPRIPLPWTPLERPGSPTSPRALLLPARSRAQTVIYSPGYNASPSRTPQVVTIHDLIHLREHKAFYDAYYSLILRPAVRRAGLVFTDSAASASEIDDWVRDRNVQIVNAGVGCSQVFLDSEVKPRSSSSSLLFVGNLKYHKNVDVVLKALRLLPDVTLTAVVSDQAGFAAKASEYGVSRQIHTKTGLSDEQLLALYRDSVATVVPSTIEGFGLPALESIAAGTPVIHWRGCMSVAEIVADNGRCAESAESPEEWAQLITDELREPTPIDRSQLARYRWDHVADTVTQHLSGYLADHK